MDDLSALFKPVRVGGRTAPNRFFAQPMEANAAGLGGSVSELNLTKYQALAKGRWGAVCLEAVSVTPRFLAARGGLIINRANLDGYKRLAGEFKKIDSAALLVVQLTHSGIRSKPFGDIGAVHQGEVPPGRLLSADEIALARDQFVEGVLLCREAGFDGVDFKLCHGYLTTQLIRPSNTRADQWGGSFENRTRFIREGLAECRDRLGKTDFVIGSRVSLYEGGLRGGCGTAGPGEILEDLTEMMQLLDLLAGLGVGFLNVSAGYPDRDETRPLFLPGKGTSLFCLEHFRYTRAVKARFPGLAVIGSAYSALAGEGPGLGAENVAKGYTDLIGYGRQSLADPELPRKLAAGEKPRFCRACLGCGRLYDHDRPSGCVLFSDRYRRLSRELSKELREG